MNVLLVEDNPLVLENYFQLINKSFDHLNIDKFMDYESALSSIKSKSYDLAILDISLGGNHTGVDLAKELKHTSEPKVVFLSAHYDQGTFDKALESGPDFYLTKPIDDAQLISTLNYFIQSQQRYEKFKSSVLDAQTINHNFFPSVDFYRSAMDLTCLISVTDKKGKILRANPKFCQVSQYTEEELIGKDHRIVNSGYHDKSFIKDIWSTIKEKKIWTGEIKNKKKDGSHYWVFSTIIPVLDSTGEIIKYFSVRQDITEAKEIEDSYKRLYDLKTEELLNIQEKSMHMSKMLSLNSLSTALAHDVRAPLSSMLLFMEAYKNTDKLDQKSFDNLCNKTRSRLTDVIKVLDTVYKAMKPNNNVNNFNFNIVEAINSVILILEKSLFYKNIEVKLIESLDNKSVNCFPISKEQLEYILLNLINNAVKAIESKNNTDGLIEILLKYENSNFSICVMDNGCGIPEEYLNKIFDLSYSDQDSSGFGLAMIKQILEKVNGSIKASSKANQGAIIEFEFPYTQ